MTYDKLLQQATTPPWYKDMPRLNLHSLDRPIKVDVCVIGAGIAGLTVAFQLVCAGKSVAVLEKKYVASGESGRTTAHLSNALDDHYYEIENVHGLELSKLAASSHTEAINYIEDLVKRENILCDFKRINGYLFSTHNHHQASILEIELQAAKRAGLSDLRIIETPLLNTKNMRHSLIFRDQGQFHPVKYLLGLANAFLNKGGRIYENTQASGISKESPAKVMTTAGYCVTANNVVVATNTPFNNKLTLFPKLSPNRTYVIGCLIPKNSLEYALFWDLCEPYHYVRVQNYDLHNDLLIIGGEDHRVGFKIKSNPFLNLENWARQYFPQMESIKYKWSGQIIEPVDYMAFIGLNPSDKNIFVVTGDSGNGMTHGTIAGMVISDLILHHSSELASLYSPTRISLKKWKSYLKTNIQSLSGYLPYFSFKDVFSKETIESGQERLIHCGLRKIVVCQDGDKRMQHSAVCTHLGGIVQWNDIEKTWDCPAHGSRFDIQGSPINCPANRSLKKLKE